MTTVSYASLGASLYVPAIHQNLPAILTNGIGSVRSIIVCTEDAVGDRDVAQAVSHVIRAFASAPEHTSFKRFIRPRNPFVLSQLVASSDLMRRLDGIVIPKFDGDSFDHWQKVLSSVPTLAVMPTLETAPLFREQGTLETLAAVQQLANPVCAVRIGANDLLGLLGIKRQSGQTIYDTPLRSTIERIVTLFRPEGFDLSAPVCDLLEEPETLIKEVRQDMAWGFYAKTCVHPEQVDLVERLYRETLVEQASLAQSLEQRDDAVFKSGGQMMEKTCHAPWARRVRQLGQSMAMSKEQG